MLHSELLDFVRHSVRSIWALECLLLLRRKAAAATLDEIVAELRATPKLIERCLSQLEAAGCIARDDGGAARYAPATRHIAAMCDALETASVERPVALRDAIAASHADDKLRNFADAFRFKKDKDE